MKEFIKKHGTPEEFTIAIIKAIPEISIDEAINAIKSYYKDLQAIQVEAKVKPEIAGIIKEAFLLGEQWGITYYTWFTPTLEKHQEEIDKATKYIKDKFKM